MPEPYDRNLFKYATSELTQDAFLCWLIAWAHKDNAGVDESLHDIAVDFVAALLRKAGLDLPSRSFSVEVHKQWQKIDIVALIGDQFVIAIEDKCDTKNHSGQLDRYRAALADEEGWPDHRAACIYLKTGDQSCYKDVESKGWVTFNRPELIGVLSGGRGRVGNHVFCDFLDHLERMESEVQAYRTAPLAQWKKAAWRGFFLAIQAELGEGAWDYVPNAAGGFMGFWWCWNEIPGAENVHLYLQLEEQNLVAKVQVVEKEHRKPIQDEWSRHVIEASSGGGLAFVRPQRLRSGNWMTIATHGEYRSEMDGCLDLDRTVETLRHAERLIQRLTG